MSKAANPVVFFDITIGERMAGRIKMELYADIAPLTAENYRALCTGETGIGERGLPLSYRGTVIYSVRGLYCMCGDFTNGDDEDRFLGEGFKSISGDSSKSMYSHGKSICGPELSEEHTGLMHNRRGLLSMSDLDGSPGRICSKFYIMFQAVDFLDEYNMVFGEVIDGFEILDMIENLETFGYRLDGRTVLPVTIAECGEICDSVFAPEHPILSGYSLMRDPRHNKGLAFTEKERNTHYLKGLLPPAVFSQDLQEKRLMKILREYEVPLQRYMAMMDLQERNEKLFYKLLIDNVEELLPVVYTPSVGEACQKYGSIIRRPQGLYISLKEKGWILEVLKNWPEKAIQVIVVTDGERILGIGDLGCQVMGIPVGKLSLYTALGGVRPSACLPVTIDVGTNNKKLLDDEFYIGLKQKRTTGQEYYELLEEFMSAVKQNYGEKVLIHFEDFANHNAFELLAKYRSSHLVFNDDIQGTASVVLAGLVAALKLVGGTLADHRFLVLDDGEAGTGIAELIALDISEKTNTGLEEAKNKISVMDSKVMELLAAVKAIRPTVLIGISGVGKAFTKEVVEAMASMNEKPLILALSNPTSQSECTAEEAYTWSEGRAIFASGSPFDSVDYNGKLFVPGQASNAYIFPGFGLGLIMSGAIRIQDDLLLAASEALAAQVTEENYAKGMIYPPFTNIRKISARIAATVAAKAYELGLASRLPRPKDLVKFAESCMYTPVYGSYLNKYRGPK